MKTKRLIIRPLCFDDVEDIFAMRKDPIMCTYTDSIPDEFIEDTIKYMDKVITGHNEEKWEIYSILKKDDLKVIGTVSLWNFSDDKKVCEIGFGINTIYQGNGYMKESLEKIVEYAFTELKLEHLEAYTHVKNTPSRKLLESCGFIFESTILEEGVFTTKSYEMAIYKLFYNQKTG
jgi:ribosomal-protein-alanine N-acetyltransferase